MSLCVISIDRYIGVRYPLQYPMIVTEQRALLAMLGVWILSIVISIGPLLGWKQPPSQVPLPNSRYLRDMPPSHPTVLTCVRSAGWHSVRHHPGTVLRPLLIARVLLHPPGRHLGHVLPCLYRGQAHHQEPGGRRDEGESGELQRAHPEDPLSEPADPRPLPFLQGWKRRVVGRSEYADRQASQVLQRKESRQDPGRGGGHVHSLLAALLPGSAHR